MTQVKVLLTLMTPNPFKKFLSLCLKMHAKKGAPWRYTKSRGKIFKPGVPYLKHKSSSLVNFAWKPETVTDIPPKDKVSCH